MRVVISLLLGIGLPFLTMGQPTMALVTQPTSAPTLKWSFPSIPQEKDPLRFTKRGDTFLLFGVGLNIISAGTYLMAPGLLKRPKNPTAQYEYEMAMAQLDPSRWPDIKSRYEQEMGIYNEQVAQRNQKVQRIRYGCLAAFSVGVTLDVAAILNFRKGKQ